jgi:TonB family protein
VKITETAVNRKPIVLAGFIALSLVAHGLLFLSHTHSQIRLAHPLGNQSLSITLAASDKKTSNISSSQISTRKPVKQSVNNKEKTQAVSLIKSPVTAQESISTISREVAQRNFLLGEIQHRLSEYLSYPTRAQRRGWQGEVMVGFHVDRQGFLHNIHLTQTSGYSLLDNATLSAIGKVINIPLSLWFKDNHETEFHPIALQLPVQYRLINS